MFRGSEENDPFQFTCMGRKNNIGYTMLIATIVFLYPLISNGQEESPDSTGTDLKYKEQYDLFYDSLRYKAERRNITRWLHNLLIREPKKPVDKEQLTLHYFTPYKDKIISEITVQALDVFGPTFEDTSRVARSTLQKVANRLHTKTNLNIIRKNLLFQVGDRMKPEELYENERIIRSLPFIKDVKFLLQADSLHPEQVKITVLTKDVFSLGITGSASGLNTATFAIYNQNIFGAGHEISVGMVGHLHREPYLGFETFYKIHNLKGKFIDLSVGFSNTFRKEGFSLNLEKEFITPTIKWGGGASALRLTRSDRITENDPVRLEETPLNFYLLEGWVGRSFQVNKGRANPSQLVVSANFLSQKFKERPFPDDENKQYFSNSTFYLTGLTWSRRSYMRDQLVYGYGITEDIPEGFKNELVIGYHANEFGDRYYAHLSIANGNLLPRKPGYLYVSASIGSYFNRSDFEQGLIRVKANYISKLVTAGEKRYRFFARADYTLGINRYEVEHLLLRYDNHIRGFFSREPQGKQRLSINLEAVFFQQREIYNFNIALYAFTDLAIIGSNRNLIFSEPYYGGIGGGIRLHNESLVLKTINIRLAYYPNHPENMGPVGFILEEQLKRKFYHFQAEAPMPLRFE